MTDASPTEGFVEVEPNLRVHYVELGRGQPTIFIHGSAPGASAWSNFKGNIPEFAAAGRRAIGLDLLGYGESSKPRDRKYTLAFHVSAVRALVERLNLGPVDIVGNSLGGAVAMGFALQQPQSVRKLVLLAPGGLGPKLRYLRMSGIRSMMWALLGPGGVSKEKLARTFSLQVFDQSLITDVLLEERLRIAKTQPKQVLSTLDIGNLLPRLPEIKQPVLAVWGVHDNFCPVETAPLLAQGVPDCRVLALSRCGHWAQVEHRATFNEEALRFLAADPNDD